MARLTKLEIERRLLEGEPLSWIDANNKTQLIQLRDEKQRRLFAYLRTSSVRKPTELQPSFVTGLAAAYDGGDDPAAAATQNASHAALGPWRLMLIQTEGFGGLNTWGGAPFKLELDQASLLLEGPNGSGKSSLAGAIIWALTGERPRDQHDGQPHERQPVFSEANGKQVGTWPPLACYPPKEEDLVGEPFVRVTLTFQNPKGETATVERSLDKGVVDHSVDPRLHLPAVLIEAGLLMPARLAQLRLANGPSKLTDAIQTLTGLDDLIDIGVLAEGLCHGGREYQTYRSKELATKRKAFEVALATATTALEPVALPVQKFSPSDTSNAEGAFATFGKQLRERAAAFAEAVSKDLVSELDLKNVENQKLVVSYLSEAEKEIRAGLGGLSYWKTLELLASGFDATKKRAIVDAITAARRAGYEAIMLLERSTGDSRFRLKAAAARWHAQHATGPIAHCPLCDADLTRSLVEELESLRSAGAAAARTFDDNVTTIAAALDAVLPSAVKQMAPDFIVLEPRSKLVGEIRKRFLQNDSYAGHLVRLGELIEDAVAAAPADVLQHSSIDGLDPRLKSITDRIATIERAAAISEWFDTHRAAWTDWWTNATDGADVIPLEKDSQKREKFLPHLRRLSDALSKAEPYRKAVEALGTAWKAGKEAHGFEIEIAKRVEIGKCLAPLKSLGALCESVARQAIGELSGRAGALLEEFLVAERLNYKGAKLQRKSGLVVHAGFSGKILIDATLVANSSWLRAVLWCFIFALREEAIEQIGADEMPFMVFDDPQATFDTYHRARWARYVASLQNAPTNVQVFLTTYEEVFLDLISFDGVTGRRALIAAPGPDCNRAVILEGASLDRRWQKALIEKTPAAAVDYLDRSRVYVEGMFKLMLRGEGPKISGLVLGDLRTLLSDLNNAGKAPWKGTVFKALVGHIPKNRPEVKYLEGSHHTTGQSFGMVEAAQVEKYLKKDLLPALARAYDTAREHRLLHGGMKALHAEPPTASLPEGYKTKVSELPLTLLGRAAARTDGRDADGLVDMSELQAHERLPVILNEHSAFRLAARTLEPVAKVGDILLTTPVREPSNRSLVVALSNDRVLARRFEISDNQEDIAVLVAQAINPRRIAPPIVALKTTYALNKIVGVLFDHSKPPVASGVESEVQDCGGEAAISAVTAGALGLVEVVGKSAEPIALDGQYLMVKGAISPSKACTMLCDQPVIAEDADGNCYFKRLRVVSTNQVVLESLEGNGDFPPTALSIGGNSGLVLARAWPVVGILFELPANKLGASECI